MTHAKFDIKQITDTYVVVIDQDVGGKSVTNDAAWVVNQVQKLIPGGIGRRKLLVITDLGDPSVSLPMKLKSKGSEANSRGTGIRSLFQKNSHGPFALPSTD
nr:hypothetical protein [uncultured Desulfobacter sp.]